MLKQPLARVVILGLALLCLVIAAGTDLSRFSSANSPGTKSELVVHEWGTFTSVAGQDGQALIWRPLTVESDLPSFVYSVDKGDTWRGLRYPSKSGLAVRVRMETPVLYFYAREEMSVAVKVGFPSGRITEWYPTAQVSKGNIDWGEFRVMPGAQVYLPNDFSENHYYPARDTDVATIQIRRDQVTEQEKFLFYRGVGNFGLPLSVRLAEDKVIIKNVGEEIVRKVVLFENRDGKIGYQILELASMEVTLNRPQLQGDLKELRSELKAMLISDGLYGKEAEAMLNTWRDSWFEEGLRIFYIVPRKSTDTVLPIDIDPQPASLVRVLVGRTELVTPQMENNVIAQLKTLNGPSASVRETALKEINRYGRFAESILTQILSHTSDPKIKMEVERLLKERN
ncbi:MAG: hypothetical protein ACR2HX_08230 [Pyrinomonadaceae bacterium]